MSASASNPVTTLLKRAYLIFTGGLFITVLLLIMQFQRLLLTCFWR